MTTTSASAEQITQIPIDLLVPAENNLRRKNGDVSELAASIQALGVQQPLVVVARDDGRYTIVAGHRRHEAAGVAGLGEVPCIVRDLGPAQILEVMLVENLQRVDLDPVEEASGYFRLTELGVTVADMARRVGRPAKHISSRIALLELPAKPLAALKAGKIGLGDAEDLLSLRDLPDFSDVATKIAANGRNLEYEVRQARRTHDAEVKIAEAEAGLTKAGVKFERSKPGYQDQGLPNTWQPLNQLGITPSKHKNEPCHIVVVRAYFDEIVQTPYCTEPKRHAKTAKGPEASKVKATAPTGRSGTSDAERERLRRERELNAHRLAEMARVVQSKLSRDEMLTQILGHLLQTEVRNYNSQHVCRLLGLEPIVHEAKAPQNKNGKSVSKDWDTPIETYAKGGLNNQIRIALAWSFVAYNGISWHAAEDFMKAHGYQPHEHERAKARTSRGAARTPAATAGGAAADEGDGAASG